MVTETTTTETEFDDGSKIITTKTEASEYIDEERQVTEPIPIPEDTATEVVTEPVLDTAVAIAEIEAEKEIVIASIHAEARVQEAEAYKDHTECQQNIATLQATIATLEAEIALLKQPSIPQASELPQNLPNPSESAGAVLPEVIAEPQASEPEVKKRKRSRWI